MSSDHVIKYKALDIEITYLLVLRSMNKSFYFAAAAVALLVLGLFILKPSGTTTNNSTNNTATTSAQPAPTAPVVSNEDKFNVTITDGKNAAGAQVYATTEGRTVRFIVTSNTSGKIDVHSYINRDLGAGPAVEFSFPADKTGRFEMEFHPEQGAEVVIGALAVNPK